MAINKSRKTAILFLFLIFIGAVSVSLSKGSAAISFPELFSAENRPILYLRLARIMLGVFAGAGLGVSGVVLQAILRNPLAEPYLLGVSSGAGLGAVVAIALGIYGAWLPFAAFLGAALSVVLVYNLARENGRIAAQSLVLSGVIVAISLSGIIVFLISVSGNEALHGIIWWLLGSLQVYDLKLLFISGAIVALGVVAIFIFSQDLNAISIGEEEAVHLGVNTETLKKILFFVTSFMTGAIVCVTGMIGFVGLIIPHMARLIVGPNHKVLIPAAAIGSAAFLVLCDAVSRSVFPPVEIPIGVITAVTGAPVFIFLLKRKQRPM